MSKKVKTVATAQPVVSEIPLPVSSNPLVIDLPDGQKLVIGTMASGAVIEVATWRGTGRPDSRTNRLMLGMSNSADQVAPSSDSSKGATPNATYGSASVETKKKFTPPKFALKIDARALKAVPRLLINMTSQLVKAVKSLSEKSKELAPVDTTSELNINQWIEQISEEARVNAAKARAKKVSKPVAKPVSPATKSAAKK